jgi:hypothetical protein
MLQLVVARKISGSEWSSLLEGKKNHVEILQGENLEESGVEQMRMFVGDESGA